jgi:hypothetical protein
MQPSSPAALAAGRPTRRYRSIEPIEGYVHKFRLEACEAAAIPELTPPPTQAVPSVAGLLAKFALSVAALSGLLIASARVLVN